MDTSQTLKVVEIVISALLVISVLLQQQGSGLGVVFGNTGGESYRSKRGVERVLYNGTIALIILFIINSLAIAFLSARA